MYRKLAYSCYRRFNYTIPRYNITILLWRRFRFKRDSITTNKIYINIIWCYFTIYTCARPNALNSGAHIGKYHILLCDVISARQDVSN